MAAEEGWFIIVGQRELPGPIFETISSLTRKRLHATKIATRLSVEGFNVTSKVYFSSSMDFCPNCLRYINGKWRKQGHEVLFVCPRCGCEVAIYTDK